jgi:Ca2+-binding RTX toxin-like protein
VRTGILLIALLALPAPCAHAAATVSATSTTIPDYGGVSTAFSVLATGDESGDELRASGIYGDFRLALGVLVTDTAGAVAGAGCQQVDPTSVRCMVPDQQIGNATVAAALDGGPGNDIVHAGDVVQRLLGGEGDDVLDASEVTSGQVEGGPGADRLIGPAGGTGASSAGPTFDGGPGPDTMVGRGTVSYADRTVPVHVDLRKRGPVQGAAGEGDTIDGPRSIQGGHGDDTLIGSRGSNVLSGGTGDDTLKGLALGDVVHARDGNPDVVRCRRSPARVTVDRLDLVLGCGAGRIVRRGAPRPTIVSVGRDLDVPKDGRTALVQLGCPDDMPSRCVATVAVRDRVGSAGNGVVAVRPGHMHVGRIPLTQAASRRARCSGQLRLTFELSFRTGRGLLIREHRRLRYRVSHRASAC